MGRFKSVLSLNSWVHTGVEMHLSIKLRGILRPKSVRRTFVMRLIYGPRANKQFDIAFWVFWTWPGPVGHSDSLIFKPRWLCWHSLCWCKCSAPGTSSFTVSTPEHFLLYKSPGVGNILWCKSLGVPGGVGVNRSNWYLHYCSPLSRSDYIFFTAQPMMPTGVLLFLLETRYACASTEKRMRFWTFMDALGRVFVLSADMF